MCSQLVCKRCEKIVKHFGALDKKAKPFQEAIKRYNNLTHDVRIIIMCSDSCSRLIILHFSYVFLINSKRRPIKKMKKV